LTIELNGEHVDLGEGARVIDAVARSGARADARGVAVAVEGEVVPRGDWERTVLRDGQSVEVVAAIQGG
jgi:sulfur carrier protein